MTTARLVSVLCSFMAATYAFDARASTPLSYFDQDDRDDDDDDTCSEKGPKSHLVQALRDELVGRDVQPVEAAPAVRPELYNLGQALAFDKLLSGNQDISCMTCHHPDVSTGDARHLPLGAGGSGLGPDRRGGHVIPRNAPALFNLHAFETMFWDSRVFVDGAGTLHTPAGAELTADMESVFEFGVVSAQAMFPVTSNDEMRGLAGENDIADASSLTQVWERLMGRIGSIPAYRTMFEAAYPGESFDDMTFAHAANAIAGFEVAAFEYHDSAWERFIEGNDRALSNAEIKGALQYFRAGCHDCHSGPAFSDFEHHNTALAQFGPGKGDGAAGHDDFGRMRVTGDSSDKYAFRTGSLLNIELTGPYGHDGQYKTLRDFVGHYENVEDELLSYSIRRNVSRNERHLWSTRYDNTDDVLMSVDPLASDLGSFNTNKVVRFLEALTDPAAYDLDHTVPETVPSGLPVLD